MTDVSGYGAELRLIANNTFPIGLGLTQFADDSDPLDVPALPIGDSGMGLNGDLATWTVANPVEITLNLIAGSEDDINVSRLFEANRAGRNKASARDVIILIAIYPSGQIVTLTGGKCISFVPLNAISSEGRLKSKPYVLRFQNIVSV